MKLKITTWFFSILFSLTIFADDSFKIGDVEMASDAKSEAFEQVKKKLGKWEGTMTQGLTGAVFDVSYVFRLTSGGNTITETLVEDGVEMLTTYSDDDGKLVVDVLQLKGTDLQNFLEKEGGREAAMESRKRWSAFLDDSTGYNAKQRGDKAKENGKKVAKAKSGINMARKLMELSSKVTDEMRAQAEEMIEEVDQKLEEGNATRALSLSEKINKMLEGK